MKFVNPWFRPKYRYSNHIHCFSFSPIMMKWIFWCCFWSPLPEGLLNFWNFATGNWVCNSFLSDNKKKSKGEQKNIPVRNLSIKLFSVLFKEKLFLNKAALWELEECNLSGVFPECVAKILGGKSESLRHNTPYFIILSTALSNFSLTFFLFSFNKGALGGLLTGITLSSWVAIGSFIYPASNSKTWPLPLSTEQCVPSNVTKSVPPVLSSRYADPKDGSKPRRVSC